MSLGFDDWATEVDEQERQILGKVQSISINNKPPSSVPVGVGEGDAANTSYTPPINRPAAVVHPPPPQPTASTPFSPTQTQTDPSLQINQSFTSTGSSQHSEEQDLTAAEFSLLRKALHNELVKTTSDVQVLRKDPNSPLFSVKSFEELNLRPELLKGVYGMGFNYPSKIQETALPNLLSIPPQNMIAQSQSGTGKTAAFVLAMLSRIDPDKHYPQALCLSPTYELAIQTGQVAKNMAKFMPNVHFRFAIRGEKRVSRGDSLNEQIIIGTPGTIVDWALKFKVFDMKKIMLFVLDEADVMIATQGHQDQSIRIQKQLGPRCQMLLFSATYEDEVMNFAKIIIVDPIIIQLRREEESLENIKQYYVMCQNKEDKFEALSNIYGVVSLGQAMVFCHTRRTASWLAQQMASEGHSVGLLSGELETSQRIAVLNRFRKGADRILITTNVCARGIDVEQVTVVINFDIPVDVHQKPDFETYLHRIGRTGRFGKAGLAINFVDNQYTLSQLMKIQDHFGRKIDKLATEDAEEIGRIA